MSPNIHFAAIILAAGSSQRMGQDKASLPWLNGKSLLEWMTEALVQNGWSPFVVLGPHNEPYWRCRLTEARIVLNPNPEEGKVSSILSGTKAIPAGAKAILITGVDQPCLPSLYQSLRQISTQREESIIVPEIQGRRGHPLVVKGALREKLLLLKEETLGLRGLLEEHAHSTYRLSCDPSWLRWNCNTEESYQEAHRWFESQSAL